MDDEITSGVGEAGEEVGASEVRSLVPVRVGEAKVYIELTGERPVVEGDERLEGEDEIYTASPKRPSDVFGEAGNALKEIVRVVGEQVSELSDKAKPDQVSVEFNLSFEAGGKAQVIPVLFTGETKAVSGLKITAVWETSATEQRER